MFSSGIAIMSVQDAIAQIKTAEDSKAFGIYIFSFMIRKS